jgi:sulfite reductase beta subunit-like hemoprotein
MKYRFTRQQKIYPIEPPCKKTMYDSETDAQEMIKYLKSEKGVKEQLHYYACIKCGKYHLTSY